MTYIEIGLWCPSVLPERHYCLCIKLHDSQTRIALKKIFWGECWVVGEYVQTSRSLALHTTSFAKVLID